MSDRKDSEDKKNSENAISGDLFILDPQISEIFLQNYFDAKNFFKLW